VPALEHSNELFGATVAAGYLHASGLPVRFTTKEAADLADQASTRAGRRPGSGCRAEGVDGTLTEIVDVASAGFFVHLRMSKSWR
jgi:hypothetical protein